LVQAEDGIRDFHVTGVQTCALPIFASVKVSNLPIKRAVYVNTARHFKMISVHNDKIGTPNTTNILPELSAGTIANNGLDLLARRSEERRVGTECRRCCIRLGA